MPLKAGKENISDNIRELVASGRTRDQAVAIAIDYYKKSGRDNKK